MVAPTSQENDALLPGTVFTPRQVRMLKIVVIVLAVLLLGGFALVMVTIVYQAAHPKQATPLSATRPQAESASANIDFPVPAGATVQTLALDGDRLAVQLSTNAGSEIDVIDLKSGTVLSRVMLKPH